MAQLWSRRGVLQAAVGVAVTGIAAPVLASSPVDAAIPSIGSAAILKIWGAKSVREKVPGTRRSRSVKVAKTKPIYEGTAKRILNTGGLCHWTGTAAPLEDGNCVLFGHRTSAGGPLRKSHNLKVGDPITLAIGGRSLTYYVSEKPVVVEASDLHAVAVWGPADKPCLTLVACSKLNGQATSSKYRLLIRAEAR